MRWGRVLRWGRVGFLRRRLPYVWDIVSSPWKSALFWAARPRMWFEVRSLRRSMRPGQRVVGV